MSNTKRKTLKLLVITAAILLVQFSFVTASMAKHVMTDLGTLGGSESYAKSINDKGQVVGGAYTADNKQHAFIWENGKMTDLGTLGESNSYASSINEKGQVIGGTYTADNKQHAFIWENGKRTDLGTLGGSFSYAHSINEKGQVIGQSTTVDNKEHAFIWENGKMTDLGTLGGRDSYSYVSYDHSINEKGQVVGYSIAPGYKAHAFIWENGKMTDLGTFGGIASYARAINERGQVFGEYYTADNKEHIFKWENGKIDDLWTLGGSYSGVTAINEKGQAIGYSTVTGNMGHAVLWDDWGITDLGSGYEAKAINEKGQVVGFYSTPYNAFIWENGKITDLGTLGGKETYAGSINEKGQIVGSSETADNKTHAVIWENVPDNSITPSTAYFNSLIPEDITVNTNGNTLLSVKGGTGTLTASDYSTSGSAVKINKGYLESVFADSKVNSLKLTFCFDSGEDCILTINRIFQNSITCVNTVFELSNPQDMTVNISGNKLVAIKNGSAALNATDYSISGNTVTIKKSYLTYFFTTFNYPLQKLNLVFDFENGNDPIFTTTQMPLANFTTCSNPVFDLSNPEDMIVNISGGKLIAIKNGSSALNSLDYSVSGNVVTIKKSYLNYYFKKFTAPWQKLNLTFDFESGNDPVFTANKALITNFIECSNPTFNLLDSHDLTINISGNSLAAIKNGSASLNSSDYSVSGNTVTIKKSYLTYFFTKFNAPWAKLNLIFDFEKGNDPLLVVTIKYRYTAIAAGDEHSVALKENGTVVAWGDNNYRQCNVPSGLTGVKAIAAGGSHTVALKEDGTVVAWGENTCGQCNVPSGLAGVKAIAAGGECTVALKKDGTVVVWGGNTFGEHNIPAGLSGVKAITAGTGHIVALKEDGTAVVWGDDDFIPKGLTGIKAITAGYDDTAGIKEDGTIVYIDETFKGLNGVEAVALGLSHEVVLKEDGIVAAFGSNDQGQCNVPEGLKGVKAIAAGLMYTVVLKEDGTIVAWGCNGNCQCNVPK